MSVEVEEIPLQEVKSVIDEEAEESNKCVIEYIEKNNIHKLRTILHKYDHNILCDDKYPLLSYIFYKFGYKITVETLQLVLESPAKAYLNTTNAKIWHRRAIHFAAKANRPKLLAELLKHLTNDDINILSDDGTALHHLFYNWNINTECVKLLINNGIDTNEVNHEGNRALDMHVGDRPVKKIVQLLLEKDNRCTEETAEYLRKYNVQIVDASECVTNKMYYYLCSEQEDKFAELNDHDILKEYKGINVLTQAAKRGLTKIVKSILNKFNCTAEMRNIDKDENPLYNAAINGFYETFKFLQHYVDTDKINISKSVYKNLLHDILNPEYLQTTSNAKRNYEEVLFLIINHYKMVTGNKFNPNYCKSGIYILQIATQFNFRKVISQLLSFDEIQLNKLDAYKKMTFEIPLSFLNTYLNNCIAVHIKKNHTFVLEFNLKGLINIDIYDNDQESDEDEKYEEDGEDEESEENGEYEEGDGDEKCKEDGEHDEDDEAEECEEDEDNKNQSDVLLYLTNSLTHRDVLQHPVLKLLINLKWQTIKNFYWILLFMYLVFFVLHLFDSIYISIIFLFILIVKWMVLPSIQLFFNFVFLADLFIIIIIIVSIVNSYIIFFIDRKYVITMQIFTFIHKLLIFVKIHPTAAIYYKMFIVVFKRFLQLFIILLILSLISAFSIYYLFSNNNEADTVYNLFYTVFSVLIKGKENDNLRVSYLFYIIFMISNILIAFVTNDLAKIQENAKVLTTIETCRYIYYVEEIVVHLKFIGIQNFMLIIKNYCRHYVTSDSQIIEKELIYEAKKIAMENQNFYYWPHNITNED